MQLYYGYKAAGAKTTKSAWSHPEGEPCEVTHAVTTLGDVNDLPEGAEYVGMVTLEQPVETAREDPPDGIEDGAIIQREDEAEEEETEEDDDDVE